MELSILLAQQIFVLFLYVAAGYSSVKAGVFKSEDSKVISNLVVYICSPCIIITSFQIELTQDKVQGLLLAFAAAILAHVFLIGMTRLLKKPLDLNSIERASIIYTNSGNLIIPLVAAVLGSEWVFYSTAFMIVQTIIIWTHGSRLIGQKESVNYREILSNPNVIAIVVGMVLFLAEIRIPSMFAACFESFGSMVGTMGMFVIGMVIGKMNLRWVFSRKRPYFISLIRLIIYPLMMLVFFVLAAKAGLHREAEGILLVVYLAVCAPPAAMVTQMAQIYNKDSQYASVMNVMGVIFCIVTMPLMVMCYEMLL